MYSHTFKKENSEASLESRIKKNGLHQIYQDSKLILVSGNGRQKYSRD